MRRIVVVGIADDVVCSEKIVLNGFYSARVLCNSYEQMINAAKTILGS